jgi:hypothetical protein
MRKRKKSDTVMSKWRCEVGTSGTSWTGDVVLFTRPVKVTVDARSARDRDARLTAALARLPRVLETSMNEVVALYLDSWNDGRPLSRALRRVALRRIHIGAGGSLEIVLSDGGLFAGHDVRVDARKSGKITLSLGG